MMGSIAKASITILDSIESMIILFLFFNLMAFLLHIIGFYLPFWADRKDRITTSLSTAYMNSTLAIVFATQFFSAETITAIILYQIPTNLIFILFSYYIKKKDYKLV